MASSCVTLTDATFEEEVLQSEAPVLVDFWATWCGPCLRISLIVDELAKQWEGKIKVGKLDVDENFRTAKRYGIMTIPTLMLFSGGKSVERLMGLLPKAEIERRVKNALT